MLFLVDNSACSDVTILQVLYFAKLILNIAFVLIPIGLILFCIIDFSKAVIAGDDNDALKSGKLVFKRIFYAVLIFSIKYIVSLSMSFISELVPDYNSYLKKATEEDIRVLETECEEQKKLEKPSRQENMAKRAETINNLINKFTSISNSQNLLQCDSKWGSHPLCLHDWRTICSSGCGFMSFTMCIRSLGINVLPPDVVKNLCDNGGGKYGYAHPDDFDKLGKVYNVNVYRLEDPNNYNNIYKLLREGKRVIINYPGHYIALLGINSDNTLIIGDSAQGYNNGKHTIESIVKEKGALLNATAIWKG